MYYTASRHIKTAGLFCVNTSVSRKSPLDLRFYGKGKVKRVACGQLRLKVEVSDWTLVYVSLTAVITSAFRKYWKKFAFYYKLLFCFFKFGYFATVCCKLKFLSSKLNTILKHLFCICFTFEQNVFHVSEAF